MIRTVIVALSGALIAAACPASAEGAKSPAEPAATAMVGQQAVARPKETRYCVVETLTGTRIARKTCQTRERWMASGFDPIAK